MSLLWRRLCCALGALNADTQEQGVHTDNSNVATDAERGTAANVRVVIAPDVENAQKQVDENSVQSNKGSGLPAERGDWDQPSVAFTIPIACDDAISQFFLMAADWKSVVVQLVSTSLVWLIAGLFTLWLERTRFGEDVEIYPRTSAARRTEWVVIISVLFLQVVPILMTIYKSIKGLCYLWRFICKLQQPGYTTSSLADSTGSANSSPPAKAASVACGSQCFSPLQSRLLTWLHNYKKRVICWIRPSYYTSSPPYTTDSVQDANTDSSNQHDAPRQTWAGWKRLYLWFCWSSIFIDTLQPLALVGMSVYVALYRSNDVNESLPDPNLLSAILNVVVLSFLATLDTVMLKTFLELWHGSSSRVCIAMNIEYRDNEHVHYKRKISDSIEDHYWRTRARTTKMDVFQRLHTEEVGIDKKWEALICADAGLGILGDWSPTLSKWTARQLLLYLVNFGMFSKHKPTVSGSQPTVASLTLLVEIFSWEDVCAYLRSQSPSPSSAVVPWTGPPPPTAAAIAAASDDQWAYEVDQDATKHLLRDYPEHMKRFPLKGVEVDFSNTKLGDKHMESLGKMLQISDQVKSLTLSGNHDIGESGMKHLSDALGRHDGLDVLNIVGVPLTRKGLEYLTEALRINPRVLSGGLGIIQNVVKQDPDEVDGATDPRTIHPDDAPVEVINLELIMAMAKRGASLMCYTNTLTREAQAALGFGDQTDNQSVDNKQSLSDKGLIDVVAAWKRIDLDKRAEKDLVELLLLNPEDAEGYPWKEADVNLARKGLVSKHIPSLIKMLELGPTDIRTLDLSSNPLVGNEGIACLASALRGGKLKAVETVYIRKIGLTDIGMRDFAPALPFLKVLDLSGALLVVRSGC
ncbi:hypothetical protein Agub_g15372 [Astrephomene gubernaculifera]|uniref:Uncharacterized protein n=1 Tax=Astrephomene gubernaculifera TaxID=47775 RepID=A0AAD3HU64_9CHLO|nr:hypothetical protein Agub_g15372 [Astrephomene gubernaculifera]